LIVTGSGVSFSYRLRRELLVGLRPGRQLVGHHQRVTDGVDRDVREREHER
jgi:hypothetical protein